MLWLIRLLPFVLLLVLGLGVVGARGGPHAALSVRALIVFFIGMSCIAGLWQRDFWPFSPYPVIVESAHEYRLATWCEVRLADSNGREWDIDPSPLTRTAFDKWIERTFLSLDDPRRQAVARFLLVRSGSCANRRILGPLSAPDWLLHRRATGADRPRYFRVYRHTAGASQLLYQSAVE